MKKKEEVEDIGEEEDVGEGELGDVVEDKRGVVQEDKEVVVQEEGLVQEEGVGEKDVNWYLQRMLLRIRLIMNNN